MWEFIIPTLISAVGGAVSSGTQAQYAERQNQMGAQAAAARRTQLQGLIDDIRNTDYRGMERAGSAQFSQAADQIEALTAGRNTFGAGTVGARNLQTQALSDMLTTLGAQRSQDEMQRQQMIASLMSDQAFVTPDPSMFDPSGVAMGAALGGGAAGLASGAASFFATDLGQAWLAGLGGGGAAPVGGMDLGAKIGAARAAAGGVNAPRASGFASPPTATGPMRATTVGPVASQPALPPGGYSPMAWRTPIMPTVPMWWGQSVTR